MKKVSLIAMMFIATWAFQACNDGNTDTIKSANESNDAKEDAADTSSSTAAATTATEADSKFSVEAASGGLMEVQLGELAQQKAQSQRVKDFGSMMVRDHSKANDALKALASSKNITLPPAPGEDHQDHIKKLSEKSGKDFDKAYMDMMVSDHKDDIDAFEKASNNANDADLKAFATNTLPVLKAHLDSAQAVHKALK